MSYIFSPACKFTTWRKLWLALAVCEKSLGISITDDQVEEMAKNIENIDFKKAEEFERKFRHDVMGHVHAFGDVAPKGASRRDSLAKKKGGEAEGSRTEIFFFLFLQLYL